MFCVPILRSCGVLLCSKNPFQQCEAPVKCMSLFMYCVISIEYSVFNDLELVFGFWHYTENIRESLSIVKFSAGLGTESCVRSGDCSPPQKTKRYIRQTLYHCAITPVIFLICSQENTYIFKPNIWKHPMVRPIFQSGKIVLEESCGTESDSLSSG